MDAMQPGEVERCAKRALEIHGKLHGVANCVGSVLLFASAADDVRRAGR
jgi:hypothetical protein